MEKKITLSKIQQKSSPYKKNAIEKIISLKNKFYYKNSPLNKFLDKKKQF